VILNPYRWWLLRKKKQEMERLLIKYREFATIQGETTQFTSEQMWSFFQRIEKVKADIKRLSKESPTPNRKEDHD